MGVLLLLETTTGGKTKGCTGAGGSKWTGGTGIGTRSCCGSGAGKGAWPTGCTGACLKGVGVTRPEGL